MGQDFILILSDELVSCPMVLLVAVVDALVDSMDTIK